MADQPSADPTLGSSADLAPEDAAEGQAPVITAAETAVETTTETAAVETVAFARGRNPTGKRTSQEVELALLQLVEEGNSVRDAAKVIGLPLRTAVEVMSRTADRLEALRAATRRLMVAGALDRLEDWRVASDVGARKKGNHAPARDWLLHAGVIDHLEADAASLRIAINIGTEEKPMRIASPLTIDVEEGDH